MKRTGPGLLALLALPGFGLGTVLLNVLLARGFGLPPVGWETLVATLAVAICLGVAGLGVRRLKRRQPSFLGPIGAARTAAAAMAASRGGCILAAVFLGFVHVLFRQLDNQALAAHLGAFIAAAVGCVILMLVGLWVEEQCAVDPPEGDGGRLHGVTGPLPTPA